jgi:integral membrane protein
VEAAFQRYRIMSFVTGTTLLTLFIFLALNKIDLKVWDHIKVLVTIDGIAHGVILYPIYLVMSFQLALKARLNIGYVVLMMLAGFVPGLAFYMEHRMRLKLFPQGFRRS